MRIPVYVPYRRNFTDGRGETISLAFVARTHGVVAYWISDLGIVPVAKISHRGKLSLLQRPSTNPNRAPLHLFHALLHLQAIELFEKNVLEEIVDKRHLEPVEPQTLHEAMSALDGLIGAVVSELDFACMSGAKLATTAKDSVIQAMISVCKERYIPRSIVNLGMELKGGPMSDVEQSIVEHIENGMFYAKGEPFDGKEFSELIQYIRGKIEVVLTEMNGALG